MPAYAQNWSVPLGAPANNKLEFVRDFEHIPEGQAGERYVYKSVEFTQEVVFAEVLLSGFNMQYTRGGDCEVTQIRVDSWIDSIGPTNTEFMTPLEVAKAKRSVNVKLMFSLKDEDPTGDEDFNEAWVGFTVVALTKPSAA